MYLGRQGEKGTQSLFQRALNEIRFFVYNCSDHKAVVRICRSVWN